MKVDVGSLVCDNLDIWTAAIDGQIHLGALITQVASECSCPSPRHASDERSWPLNTVFRSRVHFANSGLLMATYKILILNRMR